MVRKRGDQTHTARTCKGQLPRRCGVRVGGGGGAAASWPIKLAATVADWVEWWASAQVMAEAQLLPGQARMKGAKPSAVEKEDWERAGTAGARIQVTQAVAAQTDCGRSRAVAKQIRRRGRQGRASGEEAERGQALRHMWAGSTRVGFSRVQTRRGRSCVVRPRPETVSVFRSIRLVGWGGWLGGGAQRLSSAHTAAHSQAGSG